MRFALMLPLLAALKLLGGCGGAPADEPIVQGPPAAPADPAFEKVKATVAAKCGKCHNGATHPLDFAKPGVLKASRAKARIEAGTMPPPPGSLTELEKADLLGYLGS